MFGKRCTEHQIFIIQFENFDTNLKSKNLRNIYLCIVHKIKGTDLFVLRTGRGPSNTFVYPKRVLEVFRRALKYF